MVYPFTRESTASHFHGDEVATLREPYPDTALVSAHGRTIDHVATTMSELNPPEGNHERHEKIQVMSAAELIELRAKGEAFLRVYALVTSPTDFFGDLIVTRKMPKEELRDHIGNVARVLTQLVDTKGITWIRDPSSQPRLAATSIMLNHFDGKEDESARWLLAKLTESMEKYDV